MLLIQISCFRLVKVQLNCYQNLGQNAGYQARCLSIKFLGQSAGSEATNAYLSNFIGSESWSKKQQMLITQISLVSKLVETATLLIMASLVMVLVIMQQMLHTQFLWGNLVVIVQ
jgi:hypothetical protein